MKLLKKLHQGFLIIRLALFPVLKIPFFLFKSPSKFNSLKFEISILYAFLLGLILVIFSGVFYIILFYALNSELDNELKVKAQEINQSIRAYLDIQGNDLPGLMFAAQKTITGEGKDPKQWWNRMNERRWAKRVRQLDFSGKYINFSSATGESLIASRNLHQPLLPLFLKEIPSPRSKKISLKNMTYDHHRIRLVNFPFIYTTGPRYFIQVGSLHETIKIDADQLHLRRLFFNLIDNALKFTPQSGRMDIVIKGDHKKVITSISDTGKGIAPEVLPKIFERFFRAGHEEPGNGLGLSIAQSIARIHKGEIQVTSQLNEGTTFKVILPLA